MEIESLRQLIDWEPPKLDNIIGEGILLPRTRLVIYGQWKTWKSMLALHTAFTLAMGNKWFGFETKPSCVLLLQLEIPKAAFRLRVIKYANGNDSHPESNLWFSTQHYIKLDREYGLAQLERTIQWCHPNVIIIDPLYKILSGNISDSSDMMKLLDNFDQLIDRHGISVILIAHTRLPVITSDGIVDRGAEEIMGSSYLPNWVDSGVGIKLIEDSTVELNFNPMRNTERLLDPIRVHINRKNLRFSIR